MTPLVSFITSNYNCAAYLAACVESVCNQTLGDWEHLVLDSGSTDGSLALLRTVQHERLRLFTRDQIPVTTARNILLNEARGKFIAVLDADDTCMPERLEEQVAAMQGDPSLVAIGAWVRLWYQQTNARRSVSYPVRAAEITRLYAAGVNIIPHSTLLARRDLLLQLGGYDERLRKAEDYDLIYRLTRLGRVRALPQHLVEYCMRNQEIDPGVRNQSLELNRLYLAYSILSRSGYGALPIPPFQYPDATMGPLLCRARAHIRRACWRGLLAPNLEIGWRCRGLLGVRFYQTLQNEN
jgi:glycosyltransferase involved in cell wall biosynthesis